MSRNHRYLKPPRTRAAEERLLAELRATADYLEDAIRPTRRSECRHGPRPCPWVSCQYHLYLDLVRNLAFGSANIQHGIVINADGEVWEMRETCALDLADEGPHTLNEVGDLLSLTRERIRQIEARALRTLRNEPIAREWIDHVIVHAQHALAEIAEKGD